MVYFRQNYKYNNTKKIMCYNKKLDSQNFLIKLVTKLDNKF